MSLNLEVKEYNLWERYQWLWLWLVSTLAIFSMLYLRYRRWLFLQKKQFEKSRILSKRDEMCLDLVRMLSPSFAIQNYQFRGMQRKSSTMSVQFQDLSVHLHSGQCVLEGVTGGFEAGKLVAIMGPSGAGKTTFMNALCGKATYAKTEGDVWVNGSPCKIQDFKQVMGFVPQDDIVHETLTVREQIEYSAALRNAAGTSKAKLTSIVDDVLAVLQINHIQNSIVGSVEQRGISGGQRKRVNIGLELAACPTILFLDEPTSGLDSTSSLTIVHSLKKMAQLGVTILTVIHQPRYSLFTLFDDVLLLGKGGCTVYLGASNGAKRYFESIGFQMPCNENPADWFMDVLSGDVKNDRIPNFDLGTFTKLWEKEPHGYWSACRDERAQTIDAEEQNSVRLLEEEWDYLDEDGDGIVQVAELKGLLHHHYGAEPDGESMQALLEALGADSKGVHKSKFMKLVLSMRDIVVQRPSEAVTVDVDSPTNPSKLGKTGSAAGPSKGDINRGLARQAPRFCTQYRILLKRTIVQRFRSNRRFVLDIFLVLACSAMAGGIHGDTSAEAGNAMMMQMGLALLTGVSCLKTFGSDRPVFWREAESGINVWAFYWSRVHVNTLDAVLQCVLYVTIYYWITGAPEPSQLYFVPCLMISFVVSGWAYVVSAVVPPQSAVLAVVVIIVILTGIFGSPSYVKDYLDGGVKEVLLSASITRWSIQMFIVERAEMYGSHARLEERGLARTYETSLLQPSLGHWYSSVLALGFTAVVLRQAGFWLLLKQGGRSCRATVGRQVRNLGQYCGLTWHQSQGALADVRRPRKSRGYSQDFDKE